MLRRTFNIRSMDVMGSGEDESIRIAISTETPYLRGRIAGHRAAFEVLGHKSNEVNMEHLVDGAPFLLEHKNDGLHHLGVLENVQVNEDGILRADVRFSNSPLAQEILDDIKRGIRRRISVGYEVNKYEDVGEQDGMPVVRATSWTPYEASLVSIPADLNAGVGKGLRGKRMSEDGPVFVYNDANEVVEVILPDGTTISDPTEVAALVEQFSMAPVEVPAEEVVTEDVPSPSEDKVEEVVEDAPVEPAVEAALEVLEETVESPTEEATEVVEGEEDEHEDEAVKATSKSLVIHTDNNPAPVAAHKETSQMSKSIGSEGASKETVKELTDLAVRHNMTADLADWISEGLSVESVKAKILDTRSNTDKVIGAPALHLNKTEKTMDNAVRAFLRGDNSELAEMGVDAARKFGRSINQGVLYLPTDVPMMVRTGTGVTNTGVSGVGKNYMSYIETLREGSTFAKVGGSIETFNDITSRPYFSTPATASMYHESGSSTDKEVVVGVRTWSPKRASARYLYQNSMGRLNGTYDFESELTKELTAEGVRIVDQQVWAGAGTGAEITGLGIDSNIPLLLHTGSFTVLNAATMWSTVAAVNGVTDGQFAFVVAPAVKGQALSSGSFGAGSGISVMSQIADSMGTVYSSNYLPAGTVPSSYTAIAGDFSKATLGLFGPVEITRDPYTLLQTGQSVLQLDAYIDAVAWQPSAFVRWRTNTI